MLRRKRKQGFSLMEMVLVVAIIMILASVMIPNLIDAIHKAKQKRTMADLNTVGGAWLSWLTDQVGAASAGSQKLYDTTEFEPVTYPEIFAYLHPTDTFFYMDAVPEKDGWGSRLAYYKNPILGSDNQLLICAAARGNTWDTCSDVTSQAMRIGPFLTTDFDQDIAWADGFLLRWPELAAN